MCLGGAASAIGGANLLAWYGAILSESERRFVAPRVMGITQGLGAALLLPVALGVQAGLAAVGLAIYAGVFLASGLAGIGELAAVVRLRRPGRVRVARRGEQAPLSPQTRELHPDHHPGRGRGRLRALPLHLRDQRPRRVGGVRHPPLGGLAAAARSSPPRWSAACSIAGPPREPCASRSSCEAAASSSGSWRSRPTRGAARPPRRRGHRLGGRVRRRARLERAAPPPHRRGQPHRRPEPLRGRHGGGAHGRPAQLRRGPGDHSRRVPHLRDPHGGLGAGAADPGDADRRLRDLVDGHGRLQRRRAPPGATPIPPGPPPPVAPPPAAPDDRGGDPASIPVGSRTSLRAGGQTTPRSRARTPPIPTASASVAADIAIAVRHPSSPASAASVATQGIETEVTIA